MEDLRVGFAFTGSFCTLRKGVQALEQTLEVYPNVMPILSETMAGTDTRFGEASEFRREIETLCGRRAVDSIQTAEPIGPQKLLDVLVIAPCTGNTLAKLAAGIADTSVTMAAKAHLRNGRPVVVALSTNDGLSGAAQNVGTLLNRRQFYFVPFRQDDPVEKPTSLSAAFEKIPETLRAALEGRQIQPVLLGS